MLAEVTLNILPADKPGTPENAAPTAQKDSYTLDEGATLTLNAAEGLLSNDSDPEGQALSLKILVQPEHGELDVQPDGSFSYVHDHSETLLDTFTYRVTDGVGTSATSVSFEIVAVDDAPVVEKLELAQTHLMKPQGTSWEGEKLSTRELHLVGNRAALVLVEISAANDRIADAMIEAYVNGEKLGETTLELPETLPSTEADGPAYSDTMYWANLDKAWLKPGLELVVRANEGQAAEAAPVKVGAPTKFTMYTLPFYLFGLNETDIAFKDVAAPDQATKDAYFARHPVSELEMVNHPAKKIEWDHMIVPPRKGKAAYKITNKNQQKDGYDTMDAVLKTLQKMRSANGDGPLANQYYAPLLMANEDGDYSSPGGGWGGGSAGTGDHAYEGVFIHEAGHAFGMPHAADGYNAGKYPYIRGSLKGSTWGYDQKNDRFIPNFVPKTSTASVGCSSNPKFQKDEVGRCVRQDIMQGGGGHKAQGDTFSIFSDFNASVVQGYLEARVHLDPNSTTGYSKWDAEAEAFTPYKAETDLTDAYDQGLYYLRKNLPVTRDVKVHTLVIIHSYATTGVTQIYEPLSYTGNLMELIDPTDADQLAKIKPSGDYRYYCYGYGCDYTLKVTYADDTTQHIVLKNGFRSWGWGDIDARASDPKDGYSFAQWAVNVDGSKALKKLELLDTPKVYEGLPETPTVLTTWNAN